MKIIIKVLNVIGYISMLSIPVLLLIALFVFHDFALILSLIFLGLIVVFQIMHFRKTKIKEYGIRILLTLITVSIISFIIHTGYGIVKTEQAKDITNTIEKITFSGLEFTGEDLKDNLIFINSKNELNKGEVNAIVYYTDGTIENTKVYYSSDYMIRIKNHLYYINSKEFNNK